MIGWRLYALAGVAVVVAGGLGYVKVLQGKLDDALAEISAYERSIEVLERAAEETRQAQEVAAKRADFWAERSKMLDASIQALHTGDIPDAPLDPRIADIVNGWLPAAD